LLAHELAHVVQQQPVTSLKNGELEPATGSEEREASRAAESVARGGSASIQSETGPRLARDAPAEGERATEQAPESTIGRYVDVFEEVYYDMGYLPEEQGRLSKWLQVKYADGTSIDINIDEFSQTAMSLTEAGRAMANGTVGRGDRIFPSVLNPTTTPRLFAARQAALEIMEQHHFEIAMISTGTSLFLITTGAPLMTLGPEGVPPLPTTTWRRLDRAPVAAGTAAGTLVSRATSQLFQFFQGLLKSGEAGEIVVEGVGLGGVRVALFGEQLVARYQMIVRTVGESGAGRLVHEAFEQAAIQAARQAGAKTARVAVELVQNPAWRDFLENSRSYRPGVLELEGKIISVWTRVFTL
jgi:hypothetical protein